MSRWKLMPRRFRPEVREVRAPDDRAEGDDELGFDDPDALDHELAQLFADESEALSHWKDRLSRYVDGQGTTLDVLRLRPSSEPPWPASDNPMLGYLVERSIEMAEDSGLGAAVAWLAANAWFEGALAERARFVRFLDAD